jgi:hypothetical protein
LLDHTVERNLTADKINEQSPCCPHKLIVEALLFDWGLNLGKEVDDRSDEI